MLPGGGRSTGAPAQRGRGPAGSSSLRVTAPPFHPRKVRERPLEKLLEDVLDVDKRGTALFQLAKRRNSVPDFSLMIWRTPVIAALIIQEIVRVYPFIHYEQISMSVDICDRVCCAISLFQPVVMDDRVRADFLRAAMPEYLYPFMDNWKRSPSFDKLRITSLGIIGCLLKKTDDEAVKYLLRSCVVPICLRCIEVGSEPAQTGAVIILERILSTEVGQEYTCYTQERFFRINNKLASVFQNPDTKPSLILVKRVVFCFYLFSCNPRVSQALYNLLPHIIKNGSFFQLFPGDQKILDCVYELLRNCTGQPPF